MDCSHNFGALTTTGLTQGAIYALVALGYTLVYGVLRLINFAHSEVFMVGTFARSGRLDGCSDSTRTPTSSDIGSILGYLLVGDDRRRDRAPAGTALVIERVAYRPLRKRNAPPLAFLITAIGASMAISEAVRHLDPRDCRRACPAGRAQQDRCSTLGDIDVTCNC